MTDCESPTHDAVLLAGRYQLGPLLGSGGMGLVYRARDLHTGSVCALKTLQISSKKGSSGLVRFKREFRAASRLDHVNCLRVLSLEQSGDQWFYTMEHASGGHFKPRAWTRWDGLAPVALQILAALDHIHAKRIVHRDLKPENVLLDFAGEPTSGDVRVRVSDFGISKTFDTEDTEIGHVLGSLAYLAPEQLDGYADPRSDLYALGVMLYEALTGRHPLDFVEESRSPAGAVGDVHAWRALRRASVIRPLSQVAPGLPPALCAVVSRLCETDPERRPTTAATVHDEISSLIEQPASTNSCSREDPPASTIGVKTPALTRAAYLATPRLCGRTSEWALLASFFATVNAGTRAGEPFICFVTGPAGAGKSRLVGQLIRLAEESGARLESGTCREEPGGPWPLRGLFQAAALRRVAGELTAAEGDLGWLATATGALSPSWAGAEARGFSVTTVRGGRRERTPLGTTQPLDEADFREQVTLDPESKRWRLYRRIADALIERAARHTLLLVLEDAHWADFPSLELISFIVRSAGQSRESGRPLRLGLVLTHRPVAEGSALADLHALARLHAAGTDVRLGPLGEPDTIDMVASMLMCPADAQVARFASDIGRQADGNPLYVSQALHSLLATGGLVRRGLHWDLESPALLGAALPRTVRDAIGDRAARLSVDTKRVLAFGAAIGRQFPLDLVERAADIDSALLLDCLDEAIRAEFLVEHPERPGAYQFIHDHVRDAIVAGLNDGERRSLHRRVAESLEATRGAAPDSAADLAYHHRAAGNAYAAFAAHKAAASFANESYSFAIAGDHYGAAISLADEQGFGVPDELLEQHADTCVLAGRYEQALASYARRLATETRPLSRAELLGRSAEAEFRSGNTARAADQLEDLLRVLDFDMPETPSKMYLSLAGHLANHLTRTLAPSAQAIAWGRKPASSASAERDHLVARTCLRLAEVFYFKDTGRSYFYNMAGLNLAELLGPSTEVTVGLGQQAFLLSSVGLRKLGERCLDRARAEASLLTAVDQAWECIMRGMSLGCVGDAAGYAAEARNAERLLARSPEPMRLRQAWTLGGEALLSLGELQQADENGVKLLRLAEELQDVRGRGWGLRLRGHVASRRGEHARARELFTSAATASEKGGDVNSHLLVNGRLAFDLLLTGEIDQALALAWPAAEGYARHLLRHPSGVNDGVLMAAVGLKLLRDESIDPKLRSAVRKARYLRRELAHTLRLSAPMFYAGCGTCDLANGKLQQGRALFARAVQIAEQHRLRGDLFDVLSLGALALGGPQGEMYARRAREVQRGFWGES